jgi:hypothetical protein
MHGAGYTFLERDNARHDHSINYGVPVGMLGANGEEDNIYQGKKDGTKNPYQLF